MGCDSSSAIKSLNVKSEGTGNVTLRLNFCCREHSPVEYYECEMARDQAMLMADGIYRALGIRLVVTAEAPSLEN